MKLEIQKVNESAKLPVYAHSGDAGMDLFSTHTCSIAPGTRKLIGTGIAMKIPFGFVGLIWDKSGLAYNHGMTMLGGVIDSGYRGEIKVVMQNLGESDYEVIAGHKIGQMLIQPIMQPLLVEVDSLDETSRAEGGFGSTGDK